MYLRALHIQLLWRVAILLALGLATLYLVLFTPFWLSGLWTGAAFLGVGWVLMRFLTRRHRDLEQFLQAISQADFSQQAPHMADPMAPLYGRVRDIMSQLRSESASQHAYLQQVVEHIDLAIVGYDDEGRISLINRAARKLLARPHLSRIQTLEQTHPVIWAAFQTIPEAGRELIELEEEGVPRSLSVQVSAFKLLGRPHRLVSFQDISRELQQRELDAWERLIRVMTHEITNSVIPIATLSQVTQEMVDPAREMQAEDWTDLRHSLATIARRSQGLADFVSRYKQLAGLPAPEMGQFAVAEWFDDLARLMRPQFGERGVGLELVPVAGDLAIEGDREQLTQVGINLLLNALDAVSEGENPLVSLAVISRPPYLDIEVADNGPGIDPAVQSRMFVPFFTTRTSGSGIGLSLARQILWRHDGDLVVAHTGPEGTLMRVRMKDPEERQQPNRTTSGAFDPGPAI